MLGPCIICCKRGHHAEWSHQAREGRTPTVPVAPEAAKAGIKKEKGEEEGMEGKGKAKKGRDVSGNIMQHLWKNQTVTVDQNLRWIVQRKPLFQPQQMEGLTGLPWA